MKPLASTRPRGTLGPAGTVRTLSGVLLAHAGLLWLVLYHLSGPALPGETDHVILASVVSDMPAHPANAPATTPQPAQPRLAPAPRTLPQQAGTPSVPSATSTPSVQPSPAAAAMAPAAATTAPAAAESSAQVSPASSQPPSPQRVGAQASAALVLPSSDADYLNNPPPAYPRMSRRMGEQGTVVVRALINPQGQAEKAEIRTSSGYARLDEAALETVKRWRYVPGKRAGVAEAMWFNLPIRFVLD